MKTATERQTAKSKEYGFASKELTDVQELVTGYQPSAKLDDKLEGLRSRKFGEERETINNKYKSISTATEMEEKKRLLKEVDDAEREMKRMEREKESLPERLKKAQAEEARLAGEKAVVDGEFNQAEHAHVQAEGIRNDKEGAWASGINNIIRDAAKELYNEDLAALSEADHAELVEMAAKLPDKVAAGMADFIDQRYFSPRVPGRFDRNRSRVELNRRKAAEDVAAMLNPKSGYPEEAVRVGLAKMVSDGIITVAEMEAKSNDPKFMLEQSKLLAKNALATHLRTGGKLTENESFYIQQQPWGKELIDEALEHNASARDMVAKLEQAGKLKKKKGLPLFLLMLLLSGAAGALKGDFLQVEH